MRRLFRAGLSRIFGTNSVAGMPFSGANKRMGADNYNPVMLNDVELVDSETTGEALETHFESSDGRKIPDLRNYRYGLKQCWRVFSPLSAFAELGENGPLSEDAKQFFEHAKGHRTPLVPMADMRRELAPYLDRHEELFLSTDIPDFGKRLLKPTRESPEANIQKKQAEHSEILQEVKRVATSCPKPGEKALEIRYTSRVESIMGLERAGFQAVGIDNFYQDSVTSVNRHQFISNLVGSNVEFITGDISRETPIKGASLAYIYSLSVLEHVADIRGAFAEMYRILRPGGIMFHRYSPYFQVRGRHSPSMPDSPWAHLRLSPEDVERYIRSLRPHEADITIPWIHNALNRTHTQAKVQKALAEASFKIRLWRVKPVRPEHFAGLTSEIVQDCLAINDDVTLNDMLGSSVTFIAEKPLH